MLRDEAQWAIIYRNISNEAAGEEAEAEKKALFL